MQLRASSLADMGSLDFGDPNRPMYMDSLEDDTAYQGLDPGPLPLQQLLMSTRIVEYKPIRNFATVVTQTRMPRELEADMLMPLPQLPYEVNSTTINQPQSLPGGMYLNGVLVDHLPHNTLVTMGDLPTGSVRACDTNNLSIGG